MTDTFIQHIAPCLHKVEILSLEENESISDLSSYYLSKQCQNVTHSLSFEGCKKVSYTGIKIAALEMCANLRTCNLKGIYADVLSEAQKAQLMAEHPKVKFTW